MASHDYGGQPSGPGFASGDRPAPRNTERVHHVLSLLQQCTGDEIASVYSFLNAVLASSTQPPASDRDPRTTKERGNGGPSASAQHDHMQQDVGASTYRPEDELDAKDRWWLVGLELVRTMDPVRMTPTHIHSPTAAASGPLHPAMTELMRALLLAPLPWRHALEVIKSTPHRAGEVYDHFSRGLRAVPSLFPQPAGPQAPPPPPPLLPRPPLLALPALPPWAAPAPRAVSAPVPLPPLHPSDSGVFGDAYQPIYDARRLMLQRQSDPQAQSSPYYKSMPAGRGAAVDADSGGPPLHDGDGAFTSSSAAPAPSSSTAAPRHASAPARRYDARPTLRCRAPHCQRLIKGGMSKLRRHERLHINQLIQCPYEDCTQLLRSVDAWVTHQASYHNHEPVQAFEGDGADDDDADRADDDGENDGDLYEYDGDVGDAAADELEQSSSASSS